MGAFVLDRVPGGCAVTERAYPAGLPEYTVRVSARARHVRLTVSALDGLVVVVPKGWRGDAAAIVAQKREWAHRALSRFAEKRALHAAGPAALLPAEVELRRCGRVLPVRAAESSRTRAAERDGVLVVAGPDDDARLAALSRWLDRVARDELPARVHELAREHGASVTRVRVGRMRTRWGSCSARGTVSISRNVVFLPPHLADALICHELAHTRVLDHSPRFWAYLSLLDPNALAHRAELRRAGRFVPAWAEAQA